MTSRVAISYPVDALVSYHYYKDDAAMQPLAASRRLRLIGDSGAFSALTQGAPIRLADYAAWVRTWQPHLYWAASLDVIGDPRGTFRNWVTLRDRYGVETVPTIHLGTNPAVIDQYAAEGVDFMGLGGQVGKPMPAQMRFSLAVLRYARLNHPQMRFHAWGVAGRRYLDALPVYSADSSGIVGQAFRYGLLRIFDPVTGRDYKIPLQGGTAILRHGALLRRVYGVDPNDIRTSHAGNRYILIRLLAASVQQYAGWLQRRHCVTAPKYGINQELHVGGPRVHMVGGGPSAGSNQNLTNLWAGPTLVPVGPRVHGVYSENSDIFRVIGDPSKEPTQ